MKLWMTILTSLLVLALPAGALAQTGYYTWSVSASSSDPFQNNPVNPGPGIQTLYLWAVNGCYPGTAGLSAAEMRLVTKLATWSILAVTTQNGFLNAAPGGSSSGWDVLLATPCVASFPVVAASLLCSASGPGKVGFGLSVNANKIATVDCVVFGEHNWPGLVRVIGYATQDAGVNQDHGTDCTTTPVEATSWGSVKALYR